MANGGIQLFLQRAVVAVIVVDVVLVLLGILLYPTSLQEGGLLGVIADMVILAAYGYTALVSPIRANTVEPRLLRVSVAIGLLGALMLSIDLISSYFVTRDATSSAASSLLAYGLFLALLLVAGIIGSAQAQTRHIVSGLATAVWAVIVALPLWFLCEFAAYYLFGTGGVGAEFVRQEMQADFARSGSTDYGGFVMSDFFGAGFFHPVLMLFLGMVLGLGGALLGRTLASKPRQS